MAEDEWAELEWQSGVSQAEHEWYFARMELTDMRRELLRKLQAAEHVAQLLLRRPGETSHEWFDRHRRMAADDQAKVELVLHTRFVRQDAGKTLRDLRAGKRVNPRYSEVREAVWVRAVLERQDSLNWREIDEARAAETKAA
jgi:hypothetical protein